MLAPVPPLEFETMLNTRCGVRMVGLWSGPVKYLWPFELVLTPEIARMAVRRGNLFGLAAPYATHPDTD